MEFQKDNLVDVDYETMQQLVEEENRKTKEFTNKDIKTDDSRRKDKDAQKSKEREREKDKKDKNREKSRDYKKEESRDKYRDVKTGTDKDRDTGKKDRSRDRNRDEKLKKRSRSHGKSRRSRTRSRDRKRSRSRTRSRERRRDSRRDNSAKKDNVILEKTIEEARRQALEAQRDDCTVLVYRLNFNATEKDVFNFFARAGIGRVIDIKIIRDPRSGKSKGVSYVEFESQESVLLAVALSGQPIRGQAVAIQQSQAEKNRAAAAAKYKKQMIKEQQRMNSMKVTPGQEIDAPMKIYVGGLTEHLADITEMDIRNIFPFGDIDYIDLHKDPNTGKSRGYAFIQFRKGSQARAAISAMNGFEYMGKILKVGPAVEANKNGNEMLLPSGEYDEDGNTAVLHNIQSRQTLMQKLNRDSNVPNYFPSLPSGVTPNPLMMGQVSAKPTTLNIGGINANIPSVSQSSCLLLSNLFDPSEVNLVDEPEFFEETKLDVKEECSLFGNVEKIWLEEKSSGNVWVKFANNNYSAAAKALEKLNGRFFASRAISATLVSESFFDNYVPK